MPLPPPLGPHLPPAPACACLARAACMYLLPRALLPAPACVVAVFYLIYWFVSACRYYLCCLPFI